MKKTFAGCYWRNFSEPNDSKMDEMKNKKYDICVNSSSDNCDIKITLSLTEDEMEKMVKSCINILGAKKVIQLAIDSE
jgi:hypothetical protein